MIDSKTEKSYLALLTGGHFITVRRASVLFAGFEFIWYKLNMDKETCFTIPKDVTHGRGYVYSLQYHIVWCTKYRKRILASGLDEEVKAHLWITAENLQAKILAMEVMPDHIHLLLDCKPQFRPSDAIKVFKGNTARWLFLNHPELRGQLWGGHMWNPSYFVATVSERSREQIERYIKEQKTLE